MSVLGNFLSNFPTIDVLDLSEATATLSGTVVIAQVLQSK
jgi:hypothetical protein